MTLQAEKETIPQTPVKRAIRASLIGTLLSLLLLLPIGAHFLVGLGFSPVLSQSMKPGIAAGDLEITRPVRVKDVAVGDVILLKAFDTQALFSHRVVKIATVSQGVSFTTQGDANPAPDRNPAVLASNLEVPVVAATVPLLGWGIVYLASPNGRTLGIVLLAIAATLFLLRWAYRTAANRNNKKGTT